MKSFGVTSVLLPTLVLAGLSAGEAQVRQVLLPSALCSDQPDAAIATFEDADLEAAIWAALSIGARQDLTCGLVSGLTDLTARNAGIAGLVGIQNLTSLTTLYLVDNPITDISALSGLTRLTTLWLFRNSITDISALSGLTSLTDLRLGGNSISDIRALSELTSLSAASDGYRLSQETPRTRLLLPRYRALLYLHHNAITDIQPLLDNTGLGADDLVDLRSTNVSCMDVALLQDKGVTVTSDCPYSVGGIEADHLQYGLRYGAVAAGP